MGNMKKEFKYTGGITIPILMIRFCNFWPRCYSIDFRKLNHFLANAYSKIFTRKVVSIPHLKFYNLDVRSTKKELIRYELHIMWDAFETDKS